MNKMRRCRVLLIVLAMLVGYAKPGWTSTSNETALKVAFLYNFFKYIDWPDSLVTKERYTLCLSATSQLNDSIDVLKNKTINNKPLVVLSNISPKDVKQCQMLYIGDSHNLSAFLTEAKNQAIVTVSDQSEFIQQGGILGLIEDGNHLAFEVNLENANAYGLHINSQLLKLAKHIISSH